MKLLESNQYYEGYQACKAYHSPNTCPYAKGTGYHKEWNRGYDTCLYEIRAVVHIDNCNKQFESLATKPVQAWKGEGLPPVGCECELFDCENWNPVVIKFVGNKYVVTERTDLGYEVVYCLAERPERFRPIRTEEERKRAQSEESIFKAWYECPEGGDVSTCIYDAIAAGKIPHVKLESADE